MERFVLVKALDGRIGPGSVTDWTSYNSYDEAVKDMVGDIELEGGGEHNEDFGTGYSDNGFAYEIFPV